MTDQADMRDRLLLATLPHVMFDGWSRAALRAGAADAGLAEVEIDLSFPGGPRDAVEAYLCHADDRMTAALEDLDLPEMRVRDRISTAVRTRLELAREEREIIRRTLSFLALPGHGVLASRSLYRTVDAIWWIAGDRSTDFNFYSKRGLLAAIYISTLLFWLTDESEDLADSWAFLDRRIANIMAAPKLTSRAKTLGARLPDPFKVLAGLRQRACAVRARST